MERPQFGREVPVEPEKVFHAWLEGCSFSVQMVGFEATDQMQLGRMAEAPKNNAVLAEVEFAVVQQGQGSIETELPVPAHWLPVLESIGRELLALC
jgi:hypothetical protein